MGEFHTITDDYIEVVRKIFMVTNIYRVVTNCYNKMIVALPQMSYIIV